VLKNKLIISWAILALLGCSNEEATTRIDLISPPNTAPETTENQGGNFIVKKITSETGYHINNGKVFFVNTELPNAIAAKFKVVKQYPSYAIDGVSAFWQGRKINKVNIDKWTFINRTYSKDESRVFSLNSEVIGAAPLSFKLIGNEENAIGKDASGYFAHGIKLPLETKGFKDLESLGLYKDNKKVVQLSFTNEGSKLQVLNVANPASFESVNFDYFRDSENIYFLAFDGIRILFDADKESFKAIDFGKAEDKNGIWNEDRR